MRDDNFERCWFNDMHKIEAVLDDESLPVVLEALPRLILEPSREGAPGRLERASGFPVPL
jgi:hypothetical protein